MSRARAVGAQALVARVALGARVALVALLGACAAPPLWQPDGAAVLAAAAAAGQDTVVYFALPGRDLSDRMEAQALHAEPVLAALAAGDFRSAWIDGFRESARYDAWLGGGEGMGICVLDPRGQVFAARPGPQDPPELAAYLRLVADRRAEVLALRGRLAQAPGDPQLSYRLGCALLELGCRIGTEDLLRAAAVGGVDDAWQQLARLCALSGQLDRARDYLMRSPRSGAALCTEGYLRFKERRHREAVAVLRAALQAEDLGADRQRSELFLGKALHESGAEDEAVRTLEALIAEGTGSTFEGAARHTLQHIRSPDHGHSH